MKTYAIFDLDNCISHDAHRIPHIDWSKSVEQGRYDAYHAQCASDPYANMGIVEEALAAGHELIFLTGRPPSEYHNTCTWIEQKFSLALDVHLGRSNYTLLMRPQHDHRPSVVLKCDMLDTLDSFNIPRSSIAVAYDDRQEIVDMYRAEGIKAHRLQAHNLDAYAPPVTCVSAKASLERDALAYGIALPVTVSAVGAAVQAVEMLPPAQRTAADILGEMAETFRERNAVYGSNYKMVGPIMAILFPQGVPVELLRNDAFHLFELAVVKLSRLAISNLQHKDSAHDAAVYCAMIESIIEQGEK